MPGFRRETPPFKVLSYCGLAFDSTSCMINSCTARRSTKLSIFHLIRSSVAVAFTISSCSLSIATFSHLATSYILLQRHIFSVLLILFPPLNHRRAMHPQGTPNTHESLLLPPSLNLPTRRYSWISSLRYRASSLFISSLAQSLP